MTTIKAANAAATTTTAASTWEPPAELSRAEIMAASEEVLGMPDMPLRVREDIFRINALALDWDIACEVHEPADPAQVPDGADGKKVGIFLVHGGSSDHRNMRPLARLLAGKFGCKVAAMSLPGRCYLGNDTHEWPGDTINPDGTVRTPHWCRGSVITPDQYDLIADRSDLKIRKRRGTVYVARAKEGTEFYDRMAGWPYAFEMGAIELCRRHFPAGEFTVYGHGHSTGGPHVNLISQRVPNFGGIGMMENTAFGYIYQVQTGQVWKQPFNCLVLRTWRNIARYRGVEQGLEGMMRLPMLMEEIFAEWDEKKSYAQIKPEYIIHHNSQEALAAAGLATARRLDLNATETDAMVKHYCNYTRELSGPGVKPVPPLLLGVADNSVDHKAPRYFEVVLPMYAAMRPAPKVRLTQYHAGRHGYRDPEPGLPMGCAPAAAKLWMEGIKQGYYLT